MTNEVIAIASDHGGFDYKEILKSELENMGYEVADLGCHDNSSVDYPDYANKLADALKDGTADRGVLICGTGIGISIAANRHKHIRAALVHDALTARLTREHNNANVLVLGGRTTGIETAKDCLNVFFNTEFEGDRHQRRIDKMS
ncbi:ribose 5-phosphate isomerase B [Pseudemcibacter aquimaris]|uniref:ribose 5-phosphate isomerase B n=1 Tax=Pseudemcibacter aquimaris TaxID=2857064 RepID=UPI002010C79D|nr:ribose 5-phosphate isomerase B [Pseudemcibacter aquimaris]MCC3860600.1 ribose 5-phosphate isomerase B [Pseudemcibacter aquimaris]WDU59421.1 ribose 5-phosphate isomerase B [Pseudemcibacter aquimaris]